MPEFMTKYAIATWDFVVFLLEKVEYSSYRIATLYNQAL